MKKIIIYFILFIVMMNIVLSQYEPTYSKTDRREIILDRMWEFSKNVLADYGLILLIILFFGWVANKFGSRKDF